MVASPFPKGLGYPVIVTIQDSKEHIRSLLHSIGGVASFMVLGLF